MLRALLVFLALVGAAIAQNQIGASLNNPGPSPVGSDATATSDGETVTIQGGNSASGRAAGGVNILAGDSGAGANAPNDVSIIGSNVTDGDNSGGDIRIRPGTGHGVGKTGNIYMTLPYGDPRISLDVMWSDGFAVYKGFSPAGSAPPSVAPCGAAPSLDANATNASGTVTVGTGAITSCIVTFSAPFAPDATAYGSWVHCRVTPHVVIAGFAYTYDFSTLTVAGTSLAGVTFDYDCNGA